VSSNTSLLEAALHRRVPLLGEKRLDQGLQRGDVAERLEPLLNIEEVEVADRPVELAWTTS
jgi:hypothetical protein